MKEKSFNDVERQMHRIMANNPNCSVNWLREMFRIVEHYEKNITVQISINHSSNVNHEDYHDEKFGYEVRSFMYDSTRDFISTLRPWKNDGLYCIINGEKVTPTSLYFGCDTRLFREDGNACGFCYWHYACALHPVFLQNGKRYREPKLANVCAYYKDGKVFDFYRE